MVVGTNLIRKPVYIVKRIICALCVAVMFVSCYRDSSDLWAERMPYVGTNAPQFQLLAHDSTKIEFENLTKRTVLYFLSDEATSTDSSSLCVFKNFKAEIDSLNTEIFIVTSESPTANEQIRQKYGVPQAHVDW